MQKKADLKFETLINLILAIIIGMAMIAVIWYFIR